MKSKSFVQYFIELLIVIVGVTIAFWLSTRAESSKEQKILSNYYIELRTDLASDRKLLESNIRNNEVKAEQMGRALQFYFEGKPNRDSIFLYSSIIGEYDFFDPKDITYRTMLNSGDLKLINDFAIKRKLVALYDFYQAIENQQQNHLQALDQNFFPKYVYMIDYVAGDVLQPIEEDILVKNYFAFSASEVGRHVAYYKAALKTNKELDSLLQGAY